ncbi:MAG: hypothetical protein LCI00_07665 [Chloroflexi bacterium]|nr:hypothetical protein [Chloroflexota bacterium]
MKHVRLFGFFALTSLILGLFAVPVAAHEGREVRESVIEFGCVIVWHCQH